MAELRLGLQELSVCDEDTGEAFVVWGGDQASVQHLGDVMKAMGAPLPDSQLKLLADSLGRSYYAPCLIDYFEELTGPSASASASPSSPSLEKAGGDGDGMVDTFREGNRAPGAPEGRFTCWDQYKNARYSNEGLRIDFILVDGDMFAESVRPEDFRLHGGCDEVAPGSEDAALRMATAFGNFQPVPFTGGGMSDPPMRVYDMQFSEPHNGIVYTPPKYSDHVGVSLVLHLKAEEGSERIGGASASAAEESEAKRQTLKAQPHLQTRKISCFFQQGAAAGAAKGPTAQKKRPSAGISLGGAKKKMAPPPPLQQQKAGGGKKQKTLFSFMGKSVR